MTHSSVLANDTINTADYQDGKYIKSDGGDEADETGTLILGTEGGLELWRAGQDRDVVFWDRLWSRYVVSSGSSADVRTYPFPTSVCLTPSASHVAWFRKVSSVDLGRAQDWAEVCKGQRSVHVLALNKKGDATGIPQELRHPREIDWIGWRKGVSSS